MTDGDRWRPWLKASPELLARYVNVSAVRAALPLDTFATAGASGGGATLHDLRAAGRIGDVVKLLYDAFARLGITYDLEPVLLDDPSSQTQLIRPPKDVVLGRGTCVDLALLFAGACIEVHLLPFIVLLRNSVRGVFHTIVVVDAANSYDRWEEARGWSREDVQRGLLVGRTAGRWWQEPDGEFWRRVVEGKYLLVECTGFAATTGDGRSSPTLSFSDAAVAATRNLHDMDHVATLDIVRLQKAKGYAAYDPPDETGRRSVHEIIVRDYPALADFSYDTEFQELVEFETERFVGRSWIAHDLASFRASSASGYFCMVGEAGLGKTAIAADIVRRENAPAFFFSVAEGRTHLESCLRHLAVDLISRFSLRHDHLPDRAGKDWSFLKSLLEEATLQSSQILLVIDAVDETTQGAGGNTLFLPGRLPAGVYIVLTARVDPIVNVSGSTTMRTLRLAADDERQRTDLKLFLERETTRPEVEASLRQRGFDRDAFVDRLQTASDGSFMYVKFVLDDLTRGGTMPGIARLDALPFGLTQYYEQFWLAMKNADGAEDWKNWNNLYRPAIALLAAAMEPISADWIASILGRPTTEVEHALSQWRRFLRYQSTTGRWWIVHKSFSDFLTHDQRIDIEAAHSQIANHYLQAWGGLASGLPQLSARASGESHAYGRRHIAEHLRYGNDHDSLNAIVNDPHWHSMRLEEDPSGEAFQSDLLQALAAAEQESRERIAGGQLAAGISREVRYTLGLGSINSLSNNLPGELLAALVQCGHWHPGLALRAVRMNPDRGERADALAALAPLLDEPLISDALNQARSFGSFLNMGLVQVLRRLCELGQGERAFGEVLRLPNDRQPTTLIALADRLPESRLAAAISLVSARIVARTARNAARNVITSSEVDEAALADLFRQAPASLLVAPAAVPRQARETTRSEVFEALAVRWAELGRIDRSAEYLDAMRPTGRALALAKLLPFVEEADQRTRRAYIDEALTVMPTMNPIYQAELLVDLSQFLTAAEVRARAGEILTEQNLVSLGADRLFRTIAPVLPFDSIEGTAVLARKLDDYGSQKALMSLAFRAAELGQPEDAVRLARMGADSYRSGESLLQLLPRLAALGHHELAVSYAERADVFGRDVFVPSTLIGVSRHLSGPMLDRVRDRARRISAADDRRRALLGIAARYAQVGQPEDALALARLIGDDQERWPLTAAIVQSRARLTSDYVRAIEQAATLPPFWQWKVLTSLADGMQAQTLGSLLPQIVHAAADSSTTETFARRDALTALFQRYAQSGFADQALELAREEPFEGRYFLIAAVAPYVAEPARTLALEEAVREIQALQDFPYWSNYALAKIVAELSESSLRAFEAQLTSDDRDTQVIVATITRYVNFGRVADAVRVVQETGRAGDIWTFVAPHLDAAGVRDAYAMSEHFWPYGPQAERALAARRVALGEDDDALERLRTLADAKIKFASVAGMASRASTELLERLSAMVLKKVHSSATIEPLRDSDEAVVAIAGRYAALGQYDRALSMLRLVASIVSSEPIADALEGMASGLEGETLDQAVDISLRLESENWPTAQSRALAAVLPRLAGHGVEEARRGLKVAAAVGVSRARHAALASLVPVLSGLSRSDLHSIWIDTMRVIATRTRRHVFSDLSALMPVVGRLGGVAALDGVSAAVEQIVERWP